MKIKSIITISLIVLMLILVGCSSNSEQYDAFATCLTESGAKIYGAYWCPHCKDQKEDFGGSWDKINYIECSLPNRGGVTEVCKQAGITGYPTWEFADGSRQSRRLPFQKLGSITGCALP